MQFEKWQALGNDYLIFEREELPWELTEARIELALRPAFRGRLRRDPAALAQRGPGVRRRAADLQPGRLGGRALRQRRPRGDPLPAPPRLDRRGHLRDPHRRRPDHADDHRRADLLGRHGPRLDRVEGLPLRRRGRQGAAGRRRARVGLPARLDRQPAVRDRRRRTSSRTSTWRRSAPRSKATSCSPTGPTSPSSRSTAAGSGADLRARGGGDALLGHRRERRRGHRLPARRRQPDRRRARRRRARGRDRRGSRRAPQRLGRAGLRRRALAGAARRARRAGPVERIDRFRADGNLRPVQAPRGDASVHVRRTRAADRRQARRRHRRDQPRHRRPRRADLSATSSRRCRRRSPTRPTRSTRATAAGRSSARPSPTSTTAASGSRSTPRPR